MKRKKITKNSSSFPADLLTIAQVPSALYYRGNDLKALLDKPCVAIVGSRKISPYGHAVTTKIAGELARAGVVIISGLALGVDSVAHKAALDAGGHTIAVLPCGIDTIYPAGHFGLAKRILQSGGALLSEYDGDELPQKHQFIARNRIIAALSRGVLITEAAGKSGSLHTADFALEQGIEVFTVPGNITSPTSEGTNNLIKSGASPVTNAQDILDVLGLKVDMQSIYEGRSEAETVILALLRTGTNYNSELIQQSRLDPATYNQAMTELELNGIIAQSGNKWSIR